MKSILTLFLLVSCLSAHTQNRQIPCGADKYNEFNFWLGDWNVYDTKGALIGTNTILKIQNNCVMQENWVSKKGPSKGTSYNYVDKTDNTWNQLWVDNSGFSLTLKGNLENKSMVLKSQFFKGQQGDYYNRVTWTPNEDGSVTQVWEYVDKNETVIQEAFRGIYKKKN